MRDKLIAELIQYGKIVPWAHLLKKCFIFAKKTKSEKIAKQLTSLVMMEEISRCLVCFENWNLNTRIYACGAFVCKNCHERLFEDDHEVSCPNCKVLIRFGSHYIAGPILINAQEVENKKLVQCDYDSCNEKMLMKDLAAHQTKCLYKWMSCTKCGMEFLQMYAMQHPPQCDWRDVNCENCHEPVPFDKLQDHLGICPNAIVSCQCKVTGLMRKDVDLHNGICDFAEISCPNKPCQSSEYRKNMDEHRKQCKYEWINCELDRKSVV